MIDPVVVEPDTLTFCRKVAFVLVLMLSVAAIPVIVDPSPIKLVAVIIPVASIPDSLTVTADPTVV